MISTYKQKKLTWIDLESPTPEEVKSVMQKYAIHPLVADELLKPTLQPRVDVYKKFIFLILHFPIFDLERKGSTGCEIDFILGKDFLITTHYKSISTLYEITKIFEVNKMLKDENMSKNPGILSCFIIKQLYSFALRQLDHIHLKMEKIEDRMFKGYEYKMVEEISYVRRDTLDFQKAIHMHENVLNSFETAGGKFFSGDFTHYCANIIGEITRIQGLLYNFREIIASLQTTNDSLLTTKVNETMKTLSILGFLTFPLMLFASIFSMNTASTPILGTKGDFWVIVGLMIISICGMIYVFKKKKWI